MTTEIASPRRPMVCVPGFMTDDDLWRDLAPCLPQMALLHADPGEGETLDAMARHALAQARPRRFVLLGFSMGGYVARRMACLAPQRVQALVLVATSARPQAPRRVPVGTGRFNGLSRAALARSLHPRREADEALLARLHAMTLRLGEAAYAQQSALVRHDDRAALAALPCPVLVVAAADDRLRSLQEARELAEAAGAPLSVIEDCGHMVPMEQPARLAAVLSDWLSAQPGLAGPDGA